MFVRPPYQYLLGKVLHKLSVQIAKNVSNNNFVFVVLFCRILQRLNLSS